MTKSDTKDAPEVLRNTKMDLWERLMPTNPKYTKPFDRGGFKGTATNATYIAMRLTEEFGACGGGWRFVLEDEQIIDGHTLDANTGDKAKLHVVRGHLEYRYALGGVIGVEDLWFATSPQFGQTMLVGKNRNGVFTDEEAPKKSVTDCISKCAALLGIAADVHLGLFDDNKYVNQRKQEEAAGAGSAEPENKTDPAQGDAAGKSLPIEKTDDMAIARQVFTLVKGVAETAKDMQDIDDCLKANKPALAVLERASPSNYDSLKVIVNEARAKLPKADPALNDDPAFIAER